MYPSVKLSPSAKIADFEFVTTSRYGGKREKGKGREDREEEKEGARDREWGEVLGFVRLPPLPIGEKEKGGDINTKR